MDLVRRYPDGGESQEKHWLFCFGVKGVPSPRRPPSIRPFHSSWRLPLPPDATLSGDPTASRSDRTQLDLERASRSVETALEELEKWHDPRVRKKKGGTRPFFFCAQTGEALQRFGAARASAAPE